jgi:hypothetical protein
MTNFKRWILKRIAKAIVVQGFNHQNFITEYYKILIDAARNEFTEDNKPTLDGLLRELHEKALEQRP